MKWTKHKIEIKDLDTFYNAYLKIIKSGAVALEHFYCVFICADTNTIHMYPIFNFLDLYSQHVITKETITKLYTYQVLNS